MLPNAVRGDPAVGDYNGHQSRDNGDELVAVGEAAEHLGDGGVVVTAEPLGQIHNADEGERGKQAVQQDADTVGVGVAEMRDEYAAAHGAGELGADDDVQRQAAVGDGPVILGRGFTRRDYVGGDGGRQNDKYCGDNDGYCG